jgi:hypothetical protein
MPRPTREFKTSGEHTLVLNDYITGGENWQIRQIYTQGATTKEDAGTTALNAEKRAFELIVVSLNGTTEDIANRVMALPLTDYREVVDAITPIFEPKKKSETSSLSTPLTGSSAGTSSFSTPASGTGGPTTTT